MPTVTWISPQVRAGAVAVVWLVVSLLPWWQRRIAVGDAEGTHTEVFSANVWNTSLLASLAVLLATVVSIGMVVAPRHAASRVTAWTFAGWVPVALSGWVLWSAWQLGGRAIAAGGYLVVTQPFQGDADHHRDYDVVRGSLEIRSTIGGWEGPSWGAGVGLALMIIAACWVTGRAWRNPDGQRQGQN